MIFLEETEFLENACHIITKELSDNNADIPYAIIYFVEHKLNTAFESLIARLIATTFDYDDEKGWLFPDYLPETPEIIDFAKDINKNYNTYHELNREAEVYSLLECGHLRVLLRDGSQAVLLSTKISIGKGHDLSAIIICGVNRRRKFDKYFTFFQKYTELINLIFFFTISTPLTLMISPIEDIINAFPQEAPIMSHLQIIRRNARRLLKLINTLLQVISDIEFDKLEPCYHETNITKFTRELVSEFKTMAETFGLDYIIEIPCCEDFNQAVEDKVYLDHDMYETIVFNLCSNALKHTWNGRITIRLYPDYKNMKRMIVLEVVGIPELSLPNIFQRFYRIESQRSRSHEGTGIGLALAKEFIACRGGNITKKALKIKSSTYEDQNDIDKSSIEDRNIDKMLLGDIVFHFSIDDSIIEKKYQILPC
ncbi:histidine kinase-like ATPase [Gigaspora rosea]|uniref:Histidine kinase-like ATPase n=1 Tax=Gigaspora rosea TaxID=44941 RepID=A0A397UFY8_9GLOM|nr:histidine kinase-like ATPase [Gigaspora rosea]